MTKAVSEHQRGLASRLAGLVVLVLDERQVEAHVSAQSPVSLTVGEHGDAVGGYG